MKTYIKNSLNAIGIITLLLVFSFQSTGQSYVIDLQYNDMSFKNSNRTVIEDPGNNGGIDQGSIHRYDDIANIDGKTIYGLLSLEEVNGINIVIFDDDTQNGDPDRFQPQLGSGNNGGSIVYKLQFFNNEDDLPVFLYNYWMTGVDVDGSSSYREYEEVGGYTSYIVDDNCQLGISTQSNGRTRFLGINYSLNGVTFDNKASWMAKFENANNEITFAMGKTSGSTTRYYSVQFGEEGGTFTDPDPPVYNAVPLAIDDVSPVISSGIGGIAISSVLDNDIIEGNPVDAGDVVISIVTTPPTGILFNTTTGEVSVTPGTPGGEYSFIYRICMVANTSSCDVANVTVTVAEADLELVKTASVIEIEQGLSYVYTLTVTNNGPTTAESAEVNDILSTNLTLISATPSIGTWSASTWTIGDMESGDVETLMLAVEVSSSYSGVLVNTGIVSSTTYDPDATNNASSISVTVNETVPVVNNYPATGFGTLAFEDLWPGKGDYDFNDLVLDYKFEINTNSSNYINEVVGTFVIKAFGAGLQNGFGFQLSENIDQTTLNVSGSHITGSYVTLSGNGVESGQSKPTIIVFDNAYNEMTSPAGGIGVNTSPGIQYIDPITITVIITFPADTYTSTDLDIPNFNPFLIVGQDRGIEVHLPDNEPTDLVNDDLFGTLHDDSDASSGKYYKTENNLPWAINIYESFDYTNEKVDITAAHLKFVEWATSGGSLYDDWYKDNSGYRNESNIYVIP